MSLREDVEEVKNNLEELKEKSFAYDVLKDYKKTNKRLFVLVLVILSMWFATGCYLVYILNDIEYVETTETNENYEYVQDIEDIGDINDSNIVNGGDING